MAKPPQSRRRPHSLSHGRPTTTPSTSTSTSASTSTSTSTPTHLASRHTRRLIRFHHTLHKQLASAVRANDQALADRIRAQLEAQGGLKAYQAASVTGADKRRGGDTSQKLLELLAPLRSGANVNPKCERRMLDVGAVSCDTAVSRSGIFGSIERIDLRSREKGIQEQDFMKRDIPLDESGKFDLVCLSLVLNYVPEARGRGEMLERVCEFLRVRVRDRAERDRAGLDGTSDIFPALFLVLPAPCVTNSRYLSGELLGGIMAALGFELVREKVTAKLAYYLWRWHGHVGGDRRETFRKAEVNPGKLRNNFAIVLDKPIHKMEKE